ncbi:MAG: integrase arm-type DNA-binding domain-containing protein [Dokdonella sp.]
MPLTDAAIKRAKPTDKPLRLSDGRNMYLLINPDGSRWWRLDYRIASVRKTISLGVYPDVSLRSARERCDDARKLIANGVDPSAKRQVEKIATADTFEAVGREWFTKFSAGWAKSHSDKILARLENDLFPWLGKRPIGEIEPPELLACLRRIENRGAVDTAHRAHQNAGQIFRYAIATGRAKRDPSVDLRGAIPPAKHTHYPTITDPDRIGKLLRAIDGYRGGFAVKCALRLAPLTFTRPSELRKAVWSEFDLSKSEWRIPAERMKAGGMHIVPLSKQSLAILRELEPYTGASGILFPGVSRKKPMSDNTVNKALRSLGYSGKEITGHGFRGMASTLLNEQGWPRDAIERQLAHGERDKVRAAYNHAQHMPERRKMMQAWADYLDTLRKRQNNIVKLTPRPAPEDAEQGNSHTPSPALSKRARR